MNQQGDDKELKAAFAEFKELLKRESEPVGASLAPEITLEPRTFATPSRSQAKESPGDSMKTEHFAPLRPAAPQARVDDGDEALEAEFPSAPALAEAAEQTRRRRLIYLSLAIVFAGLTGLGVTLVKNNGATSEPAIADIAPPLEPGAEQASLEPPALDDEKASTEKASAPKPAVEPAPSEEAEAAPAAESPAPKAAANAAVPLPGVPPVEDAAPAAPPAAKQAAAPAAAAPIATPAPAPAGGFAPPAAKTSTAALQPATPAVEPEAPAAQPAKAEAKAAAKPVEKPAKVAKPKTKPAPAQTAAKPPKPPAPAPAVAERAEPAPPPAPTPAAPPPPPPSDNGGAFGFVKRTVNSVGSTIGDLGRSVIP